MKVTVFGLGYVGIVTAACLAEDGHDVIGVDVSDEKVTLVNSGASPIVEDSIGELISRNSAEGRLGATTDADKALAHAEVAFVCVGTPSKPDGSLDLSFVEGVARQIGAHARNRTQPLLVVFRSTMLPGSMHGVVIPAMQMSAGPGLGGACRVVYHPEFLREGSSVRDFYHPPKIVVGASTADDADPLWNVYGSRYEAPRITCGIEVAEMVKYCDNLFHALKITFANEIGQFCVAHGVDSQQVMEIFVQDTALNISPRYLQPGFAFGGSCLPKDLRAFLANARAKALELPMLQGVLPSNRHQIDRVLTLVASLQPRKVGFYGLAFKPGTDDLRESPYVELAERLLGKGLSLLIYDHQVDLSRLIGRNRSYVEQKLPHLTRMLTHDPTHLGECDLVVLCHWPDPSLLSHWRAGGTQILDLTGKANALSVDTMVRIV
jgi:GDP-mannose 6-dehydrogenase